MREIALADDSRDGDEDLAGKRAELPEEPFIWEFHATATPEWEDAGAPPPEAGPAGPANKDGPP